VARAVRADEERARRGRRVAKKRQELLRCRIDPVEVLDHQDERSELRGLQCERLQGAEGLCASARGVEGRHGLVTRGEREELPHEGQRPREIPAEGPNPLLDLADGCSLIVAIVDPEIAAESVDDRQEGGPLSVRGTAALEPQMRLVFKFATELEQQTRLSNPCITYEEHDLALSGGCRREGLAQ